jgi:hypothetical protein
MQSQIADGGATSTSRICREFCDGRATAPCHCLVTQNFSQPPHLLHSVYINIIKLLKPFLHHPTSALTILGEGYPWACPEAGLGICLKNSHKSSIPHPKGCEFCSCGQVWLSVWFRPTRRKKSYRGFCRRRKSSSQRLENSSGTGIPATHGDGVCADSGGRSNEIVDVGKKTRGSRLG